MCNNEALPPATPASQFTVVELVAVYLDYAQGYYQKNGQPTRSLDNIKRAIGAVTELYGREPVATFSPLSLLAIQQKLAADGSTHNYVNKRVGAIKRMFKWGVSRAIVPPTVYTALSTVEGLRMGRTTAKESMPVLPVDDALVDATLPYMPQVVADMVRFQRLTGARPGEVCQLRPGDVDRSAEVWKYRVADHKAAYTGRERTIYIGPKAQSILSLYLLRDAQAHCFSPAESEEKRHVEQRKRRITRVQPSQQRRRKSRPKRVPRAAYDKNSYQAGDCTGRGQGQQRDGRRPPRTWASSRFCSRIGTPISCGIAELRKCGGNSTLRPPRRRWGTPRPT